MVLSIFFLFFFLFFSSSFKFLPNNNNIPHKLVCGTHCQTNNNDEQDSINVVAYSATTNPINLHNTTRPYTTTSTTCPNFPTQFPQVLQYTENTGANNRANWLTELSIMWNRVRNILNRGMSPLRLHKSTNRRRERYFGLNKSYCYCCLTMMCTFLLFYTFLELTY